MAKTIPVTAPGGNYDIVIEPGLLETNLRDRFDITDQLVIISNVTVGPLHGAALADSLGAELVVMLDGERYKTLNTVEMLYGDLVAAGADRHTVILALGGGVVGDVAGLVAATYMRGIRFIQIPTSLLAMVDSSVGGKVGVDLPQGKNLVGAFKQPEMVLVDPHVLKTLPAEEWRCGMAEALKHGFLADKTLLDPALHTLDRAAELVRRAIQVKVDVVEEDPYEQGIRAHLNLGHTFAHAIERITSYRWTHGEAVGFGLLAAAKLSHRLGLCEKALVKQVEAVLTQAGLPCRTNGLDPEALYAAMATDKKWKGGRSRFVLLRGLGDPCIVDDVDQVEILNVLIELR
jgi:3-dehydroquinate synthase